MVSRYQGLSMNTFGKNCDKTEPGFIYTRSGDIIRLIGINICWSLALYKIIFITPVL